MHAAFVWSHFQPHMAAAAAALARAGWTVSIIAPHPCHVAGTSLSLLPALPKHPSPATTPFAIPALQRSHDAFAILTALARQQPFTYIEFQHREGIGYTLAQHLWQLPSAWADTTVATYIDETSRRRRELRGDRWVDLSTVILDHLESASLLSPPTPAATSLCSPASSLLVHALTGPAPAALADCLPAQELAHAGQLWINRPWLPLYPNSSLSSATITSPRPSQSDGTLPDLILADPFAEHRDVGHLLSSLLPALLATNRSLRLIGQDGALRGSSRSAAQSLATLLPQNSAGRVHFELITADQDADPDFWLARCAGHQVIIAGTHATNLPLFAAAHAAANSLWLTPCPAHESLLAQVPPSATPIYWFTCAAQLLAPPPPAYVTHNPAFDVTIDQWAASLSGQLKGQLPQRSSAAPATVNVTYAPPRPTITVVIPYYNLHEYLPETLESLARQTDLDFLTLLVDDGSTDLQSIALADSLAASGRLQLLRKRNGGIASARNAGISAARTSHVLVLDADDLLHETYVQRVRAVAAANPHLAAIGTYMTCFTDHPRHNTGGWTPLGLHRDLLPFINLACTASCLLRTDVVARRGYDESLRAFEDWELWCHLAEHHHACAIIPEFLFLYRQRSHSVFHSIDPHLQARLRMTVASLHPHLALDPSISLRLEMAMRHHETLGAAKPRRYLLADRLHTAATSLGLSRLWK